MMTTDNDLREEILRGEELLWLCQDLQSEKDGIDRPNHHSIDKSKTLDDFARDISRSATYMVSLLKLLPMSEKLAELGRKLESEGKLKVSIGDDYAEAALQYFTENN